MTKAYLRSTLKNTLAAIDKTAKWHDTYLDHILEVVINSVYYQVFEQNPRALSQYTIRYAQTPSAGQYSGYNFVLPVELVPLPDKRGGARVIIDQTDSDVYFVPITEQEYQLMKSTQTDDLVTTTPNVLYYVTGVDELTIVGMTSAIAAHTFTLDLLPAFTSITDTTEMRFPLGKDMEVIKMALEILGVVPPKDLLDNNTDTWQTKRQQ